MSEDEEVISVSGSEISHAASSERRPRKQNRRFTTTSYLLAQSPPKLSAKQRLMHIKPQLLLQTQHVTAGARPKPTIDVYPASAISISSLAAPLFKRLPGLARIKAELGVRDIILFKSEDFSAPPSPSDNDDDEDLKKRDLVALLSPLGQDRAEIVLADGSLWSAKVCNDTKSFAYEFTIQDEAGKITTARWVRRRQVSKSVPMSPTTPSSTPGSSTAAPPDYKFTFSIIDPSTRRHPIMATLNTTQLDVQDAYTDATPSASLHSPSSSQLPSPLAVPKEPVQTKCCTRNVEEWQKNFIHVSALWVALHQGWVAHFRPTSFVANSNTTSPTTPAGSSQNRTFSFGSEKGAPQRTNTLERLNRYRAQTNHLGSREPSTTSLVPRRATSSGAAFVKKRNAQNRLSSVDPESSDTIGEPRPERRAFSNEWETTRGGRVPEESLASVVSPELPAIHKNSSAASRPSAPALAPSPLPNSKRPASMLLATPQSALSPSMEELKGPAEISRAIDGPGIREGGRKRKNSRWNRMSNWVRKLKAH